MNDSLVQFWEAKETWLFFGSYIWLLLTWTLLTITYWGFIFPTWFILRVIPVIGWFATFLVGLFTFPSTLIHELGHLLMAVPLGAQIIEVDLFPRTTTENNQVQIRFGSVQHTSLDAIRNALIALGPLFFGSALLFVVYRWGIGIQPPPAFEGLVDFVDYIQQAWTVLLNKPWLIYLLYACGNGAMPSSGDWERGGANALVMLTILVGIAFFFTYFTVPDLSDLYRWLQHLTTLILAFSVALAINIVLYLPVQGLYRLQAEPHA